MSASIFKLPKAVQIVEVGPRDGLQNEPEVLGTASKLRYIEMLAKSGLKRIEVASFVNPTRVPQMADADKLVPLLPLCIGVTYSALVPNRRGLDRALTAGIKEIALFTAASETFTKRNICMSIGESLAVFAEMIPVAKQSGCKIRAYVSTAFYCPYEGKIAPDGVVRLIKELLNIGADEISIGDTIGHAVPFDVTDLLEPMIDTVPVSKIACHFHDTRGTALANVLTALMLGVSIFDSASGGLGGCPFAPGAAGNLATEDLVYMLNGMNIQTGVDIALLADASRYLGTQLGKVLPSKVLASLL